MNYAEKARREEEEVLQQMNMRKVDVTREEIERFEPLVGTDNGDGGDVVVHLPKELQEYIERSFVVFRSFIMQTQNVEIGKEEKVEECFSNIKENRFIERGLKFGEKEVKFSNKECAKEATVDLVHGDGIVLLPPYRGSGQAFQP